MDKYRAVEMRSDFGNKVTWCGDGPWMVLERDYEKLMVENERLKKELFDLSKSEANSENIDVINTSPTWDGEGLPPVGTVCEVRDDLENIREAEIIAHTKRGGAPVAVYQCGDEIGAYTASLFHPIRTPEQIAAEEREKAVENMLGVILNLAKDTHPDCTDICEGLYDAGYRRVEDK